MIIKNDKLRNSEKNWLYYLLNSRNYDYKKEIIKQLEIADIERDFNKYHLFIEFKLNGNFEPICNDRIFPIEMRVFRYKKIPMEVLLHLKEKKIYLLEVFNADSSEMDLDYIITNKDKIEIVFSGEH